MELVANDMSSVERHYYNQWRGYDLQYKTREYSHNPFHCSSSSSSLSQTCIPSAVPKSSNCPSHVTRTTLPLSSSNYYQQSSEQLSLSWTQSPSSSTLSSSPGSSGLSELIPSFDSSSHSWLVYDLNWDSRLKPSWYNIYINSFQYVTSYGHDDQHRQDEPVTKRAWVFSTSGGLLKPRKAFFISSEILYVVEGPWNNMSEEDQAFLPVILYRRDPSIISFRFGQDDVLFIGVLEIASYLHFMDVNPVMIDILRQDGCFLQSDRYLISTAFIYLRQSSHSFSINLPTVLAALILANKYLEDGYNQMNMEILFSRCMMRNRADHHRIEIVWEEIVRLELDILQTLNWSLGVTTEDCEQIISAVPYHPIWNRWRHGIHVGAQHLPALDKLTQEATVAFFQRPFTGPIASLKFKTGRCLFCSENPSFSYDLVDRFTESPLSVQLTHASLLLECLKLYLANRTFSSRAAQNQYLELIYSESPETPAEILKDFGIAIDKVPVDYWKIAIAHHEMHSVLIRARLFKFDPSKLTDNENQVLA